MENDNQETYYNARNPFEPQKNIRPPFLTVLCVLTFIGSGFGVLGNLLYVFIAKDLANYPSPFSNPMFDEMLIKMSEVEPWKYAILALLSLSSIIGAVFMLYMKKQGFHIYTAAQILNLFLTPLLMLNIFNPGLWAIFTTLLFIGLYATHYKKMTWNLKDEDETQSL